MYNSQDTETTYVLFTIAKIQKQPKYPSIDAWIKKTYIYTQYYSAIKMNEILPVMAIGIDPKGIMLSKTKNDIFYNLTNMWNLKNNYNRKENQAYPYGEQIWWLPEVGVGE